MGFSGGQKEHTLVIVATCISNKELVRKTVKSHRWDLEEAKTEELANVIGTAPFLPRADFKDFKVESSSTLDVPPPPPSVF